MNPSVPTAAAACIHRVFEEQAARTPGRLALSCGEESLTYQDLNDRANQLAQFLIRHGVKPNTPVALCLDRSLEMVVAILAVLKAGGAYVPVDLAYPAERLAFMLEDTRAPIVVTQRSLLFSLPAHGARVICLEADWDAIRREPATNPAVETTGRNIAYIIFTSGSTGKPKGVLVTHHNVVRLFQQTEPWYGFDANDVWTLFHSYAFDFSVWEIWGALFYGGRLVVVPHLISRSPEAFYELLGREGVTVLNQTPSAFRQLIWAEAAAERKQELALRYVIFGGEALQLKSLEPWFQRHADDHPLLVNMYGITETTVHVTYRPIRRADVEGGLPSVIGAPIPDLEFYLLDDQLRPVAAGCPGEICVGGDGVAAGYLNRPELTAEKFIAHPFRRDGGRLYRSGDLARRLPGGEVEFLGRKDHQVKIRGFRIELGEIEAALQGQAGVRECVVAARADGEDQRLIGYVVPKAGQTLSVSALRQWLQAKIPEYMIPAAFVFLDRLPMTLNGKVDLKALPEPERERPALARDYVAPASDNERALAEIWRDVLGLERVGVEDSFFELGGDSIRSIQVLARAHQKGLRFSLQQLFEHPTIGQLAGASNGSSEDMAAATEPFALISAADQARLPVGLEDAYPMAQLQTGMVFHSDLDPASAIFHDVFSFRLKMGFDATVLARAVRRLAGRHAIFRTSFDLGMYSQPLQLVHRNVEVPLTVEDLRALAPEAQRQSLVAWVEQEKRNRFDWNAAPFLRLHVQRQADEVFQFVVSFHHAIMDGWSLAAMLTELFQDYAALLQGTTMEIAPLRATFRDFVRLEAEAMAREGSQAFWRRKMEGAALRRLPRWPEAMRKGGHEQTRGPEIIFTTEVLRALRQLAQTMRVPFRTLLLAAHVRVMGRLSGQGDVTTGLVTNGRPQMTDGEKLIGLFLNTLPLRVAADGGTWQDLVRATFEAEKEIIPHRRCSLAQVQRLAGGGPLFETAFDFVQFHVYRGLPGYGERAFLEDHYFEANNFNLYTTFMLDADSSQLQMHFDYNPNEFCEEQIRLMCEYYANAVRSLAFSPEARYESISLLPEDERKQLIEEWNATSAAVPDVCIHHLFESQAAKTPDAPAVSFQGQTLSYRALDQAANALADELRRHGAGPDTLVGIECERSLEMLVNVLAVLKSGAAYVPLDPAFPKERVEFMSRDAGLQLFLTKDGVRGGFIAPAAAPAEVTPGNLAYVIYTSGSTGQPKGVQISHRAVVNFLTAMKQSPGLRSGDVLLAVTTLSFDIAGLELLLPLTVGAKVVIARAEETMDFPALARLLESSRATVMQATPTTWRGLIESGWDGGRRLKALCGGEALPRDLADKLLQRCGELWNLYGPTETTIWSTAQRVTNPAGAVPVGRPIANTQIYLLDAHGLPVPTGADGEIYIGGTGLARGYFQRPELTAEKFVPDSFGGGRLYRTGDIGRYLPDGVLLCAGRVDQQVKIRGVRIELGEIESLLGQHPKIAAVAVAARESGNSGKELAAYYVSRNDPGPSATELRSFLAERLPTPMLPSHFIRLPELPLTPNGKVDRQRLPEPDGARPDLTRPFLAPRTPIEEILAAAWSDVLKIAQVGIHDNFFELGGHSLSAMQVLARLRLELDTDITMASFFEMPTIEEFAWHLLSGMAMETGVNYEDIMDGDSVGDHSGHSTRERAGQLARSGV
jgi:amino acid adenylation domain-containing protein